MSYKPYEQVTISLGMFISFLVPVREEMDTNGYVVDEVRAVVRVFFGSIAVMSIEIPGNVVLVRSVTLGDEVINYE